jgi:alkanesulfonate monooxygenase SsuD/methylene tetrahydromethanopterin reductase-like flavin-dependent oxidoreductase (luciferase family)
MTIVAFGMFEWVDKGTGSIHDLYAERLKLVEMAERHGFWGYHLAEHHGTPLGVAPSPSIFLSAIAQRTSRLRFGPLAYLLPLYNPLRLAEEICMLDQLSGGRLEVAVSRGVSPYEVGCFDVDAANSREIFDESLAVIRLALTQPVLNFEGKHYRYHDVPMAVKPFQQPHPPLWYPTHNPDSVELAARAGYHFATIGPTPWVAQLTERFRTTWAAHQHDPGRMNGKEMNPRIGTMRQVVVADTDAEAMTIARNAYPQFYDSITWLWHRRNDRSVDQLFDWDKGLEGETILVGSPATVREKIQRLVTASGINYFMGSFAWGALTFEQSARSLDLFAREVMPAVQG